LVDNKNFGEVGSLYPISDEDRDDLIALLKMRFGTVPSELMTAISAIHDLSQIDHLILVAANASGWSEFISEVRAPGFRLVGQEFDPLSKTRSEKLARKDESDGQ
jgi:hypothetical protein